MFGLRKFLLKRGVVTSLIAVMIISSILTAVLREQKGKALSPFITKVKTYNNILMTGTAAISSLSLIITLLQLWQREKAIKSFLPGQSSELSELEDKDINVFTDAAKDLLTKMGYAFRTGQGMLIFDKNKIGRWGTLIFHAGLLLIVVSFMYRGSFGQRGYIQLIEGDRAVIKDVLWTTREKGIFTGNFDLDFEFGIDKIMPDYWDNDELKDIKTESLFADNNGERKIILSLKEPANFHGISVYQTDDYGYVTTFLLNQRDREPLTTHYLLKPPEKKEHPFTGDGDFPTTDYDLKISFFPDLLKPSFEATLPGVDLNVKKMGQPVFDGRVFFSQQVPFAEDELVFSGISYWTGIIFTRRQGTVIFYAGVLLAVTGSALYYLFFPKQITISIISDGNRHKATGCFSMPYPAQFPEEEIETIQQRLSEKFEGRKNP